MHLSKQAGDRIVAATKRIERTSHGGGIPPRPRYPITSRSGFAAVITSVTTANTQGAGPQSALVGDANAGKYSFAEVAYRAAGTASVVNGGVVGTRTDPDGFAREEDGSTNVAQGTVVWMKPVRMDPSESHYYYSFRYDLVVAARTKVLSAYPSVAAACYACETQTVSGAPAEGRPATLSTTGDTFFAYNLGTAAPPQGIPIVCSRVNSVRGTGGTDTSLRPQPYWVFRYDG